MGILPNPPIHYDDWLEWLAHSQFWGLVVLGVSVVALVAANIVDRYRPPPPPYVLVTNIKGEPLGKLQPVVGTYAIPDQVIRWFLADYASNVFTIENNFDEESHIRLPKIYGMMPKHSQASKALTDWYKANKDAHNPIVQCYKGWQEANVLSTVKLPAADTYAAYVQTVWHSTADQGVTTKGYRLIMHVVVGLPSETNDLGLGVDNIDLQEQAG